MRVRLRQKVRVVGEGSIERRARRHHKSLDLGGRARVHDVQAADGFEFVVHLEVRRRRLSKRRVHEHIHARSREDLRQPPVRRGFGEIDAMEAHAAVETKRPPVIERQDLQLRGTFEQAVDESSTDEGPQPRNGNDTGCAHGLLPGENGSRLAARSSLGYHRGR